MSSNLGQSTCLCGHQFTLGSFHGQPIEFRQIGDYAPQMGCKLVCPSCGKVYFGWIRHDYEYWSRDSLQEFDKDTVQIAGRMVENSMKGKFAKRIAVHSHMSGGIGDNERVVQLGFNQIDLSFYETGRDEGEGVDDPNPSYIFTDDSHPLTDWMH